jgi:carbamoylphosphate synthase small subunit
MTKWRIKMPEHNVMTNSSLGDVLSQKTLVKEADTKTLVDKVRESGKSFEEVFNEGVKNMSTYKVEIPSLNETNGKNRYHKNGNSSNGNHTEE